MMKIETERLYIRHFVNEDASICFEGWGTDEHLGDFIMGYPMNMDQMNSFCKCYGEKYECMGNC